MTTNSVAIPTTLALSDDDAPPRRLARPAILGWVWRFAVLLYAASILVFLYDVKAELTTDVQAFLLLRIYGVMVTMYLASRMTLALCYRPSRTVVADADLPSVAAVVPAFNEEERIIATIDSLYGLDYPADKLRVIVIDDGSSDATWDRMVDASANHPTMQALRFSRNRGKRAGMAAGIRAAADSDIMLFVDSDSTIEPQALREMVKPFAGKHGARVGVVTGHADVLNASVNLLTRLQQVRYYAAFRVIKAAESIFSVVSCASGCFSAYRTPALLEVLDEWENQTFLGQEATFGDDRALTNYLLKRRWGSVYQSTAVCGTAVPEKWSGFLRQQLRWKKSWARESLRVVQIAWRWNPVASLTMYASVLFQLFGPFVAFYAMVVNPIRTGGDPFLYLVGLHAMAILYGLFFAWSRRDPSWWGGIFFAFFYSAVLCWQTYWAILKSRDTRWGTRLSNYDEDSPLQIREIIGDPGDCGLPYTVDAVRHDPGSGRGGVVEPAPVTGPGWRSWVGGFLAIPLSALPIAAWIVFA